MTAHNYPTPVGATAWQRYLDREHAARDMYLEVTSRASHEYLTGPWPDRAAYEVVERQAWATYYAAGRDAWRTYTREATPPPPPPSHGAAPYLTRDAAGEVWPTDRWQDAMPSYTPNQEGTELWPPRFPVTYAEKNPPRCCLTTWQTVAP